MPASNNVSKQDFERLVRRVEVLETAIQNMTLNSLKDVSTSGASNNAVLGFDSDKQEWSPLIEE